MKRIKKFIGLLFLNLVGTGFYNFGKDEEKEIKSDTMESKRVRGYYVITNAEGGLYDLHDGNDKLICKNLTGENLDILLKGLLL
jgi:hypothetical protein